MPNFLKQAVELSKQSVSEGKFPAGAVLVYDNQVIASSTSSSYPNQHLHAETRIIDEAIANLNKKLEDFEVYTSLAPCLMCFGKIYWSGVSKVYYVLGREDVDVNMSYEGKHDFEEIVQGLNRKIEFIQDKTLHEEALDIYNSWEPK